MSFTSVPGSSSLGQGSGNPLIDYMGTQPGAAVSQQQPPMVMPGQSITPPAFGPLTLDQQAGIQQQSMPGAYQSPAAYTPGTITPPTADQVQQAIQQPLSQSNPTSSMGYNDPGYQSYREQFFKNNVRQTGMTGPGGIPMFIGFNVEPQSYEQWKQLNPETPIPAPAPTPAPAPVVAPRTIVNPPQRGVVGPGPRNTPVLRPMLPNPTPSPAFPPRAKTVVNPPPSVRMTPTPTPRPTPQPRKISTQPPLRRAPTRVR